MISKLARQDMKSMIYNHLIDINSGEIVEFVDKDIEELQKKSQKNWDTIL